MAERISIDPSAIAGTARTALDLTPFIAVAGPNWGDAEISAYMSDGLVGSSPVDFRLPNRVVTIPLALQTTSVMSFSDMRMRLQEKVGLLQRAGGWVMREVGTTPLYAEVVNATLHLGGSWLQAYRDIDVDAVLTLECLPEFFGDEITLDSASGIGSLASVLKLSGVNAFVSGNHPGRARIIVTDTSAHDQQGLLWGVRSKHYDSASTAKLIYEAEALQAINGAALVAHSGASGGTVVKHSALPANAWVPMLSTNIGGTAAMTHTGSYRVWARCYAGSVVPQLQLLWGPADAAHPVTNDPVQLPTINNFHVLDLGEVRLDAPPIGAARWQGVIQTKVTAANLPVEIDQLFFQPLDESAGTLAATSVPPASSVATGRNNAGTASNDAAIGTVAWSNPTNVKQYDGQYASASTTSGQLTEWLKSGSHGFNLPSSATVLGIMMTLYDKSTGGGPNFSWGRNVNLVKAGTVQSGVYVNHSFTTLGGLNLQTFGGPTDLWGLAWLYSDINSATFGCAARYTNFSSDSALTLLVDYMAITVYYQLAGGFAIASDTVIRASQSAELRTEGMFREDASGTYYAPVSKIVGDLPRLPPSGLEGQPVEVFAKPSRGDFDQGADAALDGFTAQVVYRPTYLFSP